MKNIRTIFMGTPAFAGESLAALVDAGSKIIAVFTAPDRPAGRGREMQMPEVKKLAIYENINVYQPERIRDEQWVRLMAELKPDLIVVTAFGQIIPESILKIPKYGCINVHGSLLPKYRGASPIHFALLNGETETGITIMKMDAGMDTGPILKNKKIKILKTDNLPILHDKLSILGAELLIKVLPEYLSGKLKPKPQNNKLASYTKILKKNDGKINWNKNSRDLVNMIRAFNPWPGTFTQWEGKCIKILTAISGKQKIDPGRVVYQNNKIFIGTGDGSIEVLRLQLAGKNCLIAQDFIRGCSMLNGYYCK